jgi:uroporphyrinogen-III synthase
VSTGGKTIVGRRVLVTRAPKQASELADRLREAGAEPVLIPTIEIVPPGSYEALDRAIGELSGFDVVAFTSANAVEAFAERCRVSGVRPEPRRVAVVGKASQRAVEAVGLKADVIPPVFTAESLAETLAPEAMDRRFLLVLAEAAPMTLRDGLMRAGAAEVRVVAAYSNRVPEESVAAVREMFADEAECPDAVTFTSASTATNLIALLDAAGVKLPDAVVRASIGPVTSKALSELRIPAHVEARESTVAGLVEALVEYLGRR